MSTSSFVIFVSSSSSSFWYISNHVCDKFLLLLIQSCFSLCRQKTNCQLEYWHYTNKLNIDMDYENDVNVVCFYSPTSPLRSSDVSFHLTKQSTALHVCLHIAGVTHHPVHWITWLSLPLCMARPIFRYLYILVLTYKLIKTLNVIYYWSRSGASENWTVRFAYLTFYYCIIIYIILSYTYCMYKTIYFHDLLLHANMPW